MDSETDAKSNIVTEQGIVAFRKKKVGNFSASIMVLGGMLYLAILILTHAVSIDSYKNILTKAVWEATGLNMVVEGGVELDFFPSVAVSFQDIRFQSAEGDAIPIMNIDVVRLEYNWSDLFFSSGVGGISRIEINQVTLSLTEAMEAKSHFTLKQKKAMQDELVDSLEIGTIKFQQLWVNYQPQPYHTTDVWLWNFGGGSISFDDDTISILSEYDDINPYLDNNLEAEFQINEQGAAFRLAVNRGKSFVKMQGDIAEDGVISATYNGELVNAYEVIGVFSGVHAKWLQRNISDVGLVKYSGSLRYAEEKLALDFKQIVSPAVEMTLKAQLGAGASIIRVDAAYVDWDSIYKRDLDAQYELAARKIATYAARKSGHANAGQEALESLSIELNIDKFKLNDHEIRAKKLNYSVSEGIHQIKTLEVDRLPGGGKLSIVRDENRGDKSGAMSRLLLSGDSVEEVLKWISLGDDIVIDAQADKKLPYQLAGKLAFDKDEWEIQDVIFNAEGYKARGLLNISLKARPRVRASINLNKLSITTKASTIDEQVSVDSYFDKLRNFEVYIDQLLITTSVDELVFNNQPAKNVRLNAAVDNGVLTIWDTRFDLDQKPAAISVVLDISTLQPKLDVKASFEFLDKVMIAKILGFEIYENMAKEKQPFLNEHWPERPLDFSFLRPFEGSLELYITNLKYNDNLNLYKLRLVGKLEKEKLTIESLKAALFDTQIDLTGAIGLAIPSFSGVFTLPNTSVQALLNGFFGYKGIRGRAGVSGSFSMVGESFYDWISSFQGGLSFVTRGFTVDGFDLALLKRKMPVLKGLKEVRYWAHKSLHSGYSAANYATGTLSVADGLLKTVTTDISMPDISSYNLDLEVDLPSWTVNIKNNMMVSGLFPVELSVTGDLDRPFVYWDYKGAEKYWEQRFFGGR